MGENSQVTGTALQIDQSWAEGTNLSQNEYGSVEVEEVDLESNLSSINDRQEINSQIQ